MKYLFVNLDIHCSPVASSKICDIGMTNSRTDKCIILFGENSNQMVL